MIKSFVFDGVNSQDRNLIITGSTTSRSLIPSKTLLKSQRNGFRMARNQYGSSYDNDLIVSISVMKNPCKETNQTDLYFTPTEISNLMAWLTSPIGEKSLTCVGEAGTIIFYGGFTDIEPDVVNGKLVGLNLTFECNAPYGYYPVTEYTLSFGDKGGIFSISNNSDEKYIPLYPVIKITPTYTGSITLTNTETREKISLEGQVGNVITIDNRSMIITNAARNIDAGWGDKGSIYWVSLKYGSTTFSVDAACLMKWYVERPRKVGDFI